MHKEPQPIATRDAGSKNVLQIKGRKGVSEERQLADLATDGIATNAITATTYLGATQPNVSLTEMVASLQDHGKRVNATRTRTIRKDGKRTIEGFRWHTDGRRSAGSGRLY